MISWREDLNIGVPAVDTQHQELVRILNDFLAACTQQKGKDKIVETLEFLVSYTITHFHDEEQIMIRTKFPDYEAHKLEHERFVQDISTIKRQVEDQGVSVLTTIKINRTLVDWLINHIQKNDQLLGSYIKSLDV
ncbi:MAG: bacteriohemerythrin [Gorillibacterium sp.]|nr:bacteriohemerythrin [Gorillibacterium sp.]